MNSLVAQQQGYTFPMDEIPRTYYPGRGFLSDQEAYPENPFYRVPRYSGGDPNLGNTAGMFNLPYYGGPMNPTPMPYYPNQDYGGVELLAGSPSFDLNYGRGRDGTSLEGIPNANDPVMRQKLRNRLLKNPAGTESLPWFLKRV